jgi:sulfate adenylyltransferase
VRREVRELIDSVGAFIEVHIHAPIEVCETRDRKGLYAKARAGLIKGFTGIDDPYEEPEKPEIKIDTSTMSVEEAAATILLYLENEGFIAAEAEAS